MLSTELKEIYSSNPTGIRAYDTIELNHPSFLTPYFFIRDNEDKDLRLTDTAALDTTFYAYPFSIILPEAGATQQDISFVLDNTSQMGVQIIEEASTIMSSPITLTYRAYVDGSIYPASSAMKLSLTNIVADNNSITAIATRSDLYKRSLPAGQYAFFDDRFKGLYI